MRYAVSTDRRWLIDGRARIWDERRSEYVLDALGQALSFATADEAQGWLDGFCDVSGVPRGRCVGCMEAGRGLA